MFYGGGYGDRKSIPSTSSCKCPPVNIAQCRANHKQIAAGAGASYELSLSIAGASMLHGGAQESGSPLLAVKTTDSNGGMITGDALVNAIDEDRNPMFKGLLST